MITLPSTGELMIKSVTAIECLGLASGGGDRFSRLCKSIAGDNMIKAMPAKAEEAKAPWGVPQTNRAGDLVHLKNFARGHLQKCLKAMKEHGVEPKNLANIQMYCEHALERNEIAPEDLMKHLTACVEGARHGVHKDVKDDALISMGHLSSSR
ncbi:hypothetical protein ID007_004337 [Salmonella enterica]|nr:hypothetical protein [Salmonella enterica]